MKRVEILWFILMMVNIFWLWSKDWHSVAFSLMSLYAIIFFIEYAMERTLSSLSGKLIKEYDKTINMLLNEEQRKALLNQLTQENQEMGNYEHNDSRD